MRNAIRRLLSSPRGAGAADGGTIAVDQGEAAGGDLDAGSFASSFRFTGREGLRVIISDAAETFELRLVERGYSTPYPSIEFEAHVRIERFDEHLLHRADIYIDTESWDAFVAQLASSDTEVAFLADLSNEWRLTVRPSNADRRLELAVHQYHYDTGALGITFTSGLNDAQLRQLVEAFTTWPRWWSAD